MPFQRYLDDASAGQQHQNGDDPFGHSSSPIPLQIPQFLYGGAPTLAPGGGAEVLFPAMFNPQDVTASSWLAHSGFNPYTSNYVSNFLSAASYSGHFDGQSDDQTTPTHAASDPTSFHGHLSLSSSVPPHDLSMFLRPSISIQSAASPHDASVSPPDLHHTFADVPPLPSDPTNITAPSALGLPVYSASGFDLLSVLTRVATRPNPRVVLGPVDLTCSFVVVDVRRHDNPIVYCSPTFCHLTGYSEHEVLGRNCRFLQAPGGNVRRGEQRQFTSHQSVAFMKKNLVADKECQISIVNYKKDGKAFINLVTVIPISGGVSGQEHEENDVVYHVGFQVDLTEQPNAILQKLRDGSYIVNYTANSEASSLSLIRTPPQLPPIQSSNALRDGGGGKKPSSAPPLYMSRVLRRMLNDPKFLKRFPLTTSTTVLPPNSSSSSQALAGSSADASGFANHPLSLVLLENTSDFIHVVSLKGSFLYVAPSVRRVLGYEPDELVGKSVADIAHPEDVVPIMRELKDGSSTGAGVGSSLLHPPSTSGDLLQQHSSPRSVDMLFRARVKSGRYVWVECRGRLHVEPGKGRKAIILSGRAREMSYLEWGLLARCGSLEPMQAHSGEGGSSQPSPRGATATSTGGGGDFWGMVSGHGSLLVAEAGIRDMLGWESDEIISKRFESLMLSALDARAVEGGICSLRSRGPEAPDAWTSDCEMAKKDGSAIKVRIVLYRTMPRNSLAQDGLVPLLSITPPPIVIHVRTIGTTPTSSSSTGSGASSPSTQPPLIHPPNANVFEELETSRNSSWQYELQQLKFANQRLVDEARALEAQFQAMPLLTPPVLVPSQGGGKVENTAEAPSSFTDLSSPSTSQPLYPAEPTLMSNDSSSLAGAISPLHPPTQGDRQRQLSFRHPQPCHPAFMSSGPPIEPDTQFCEQQQHVLQSSDSGLSLSSSHPHHACRHATAPSTISSVSSYHSQSRCLASELAGDVRGATGLELVLQRAPPVYGASVPQMPVPQETTDMLAASFCLAGVAECQEQYKPSQSCTPMFRGVKRPWDGGDTLAYLS